MNFFTSDLHFLHKNILKFKRGYYESLDAMHKHMIEVFNSTVLPSDSLYILGDIALGSATRAVELLEQLRCNLFIVPGNHDSTRALNGYSTVATILPPLVEVDGMVLCHFPLTVWNKSHLGAIHIHGHTHGSFQGQGRCLDVGWDNVYKQFGLFGALSTDNIKEILSEKEVYNPSHHGNDRG